MAKINIVWRNEQGCKTAFQPSFEEFPSADDNHQLLRIFMITGYRILGHRYWYTNDADGPEKLIAALTASGWQVTE